MTKAHSETLQKLDVRVERLTTQPLRMVSLHVTDYCNSKCDFCVVNSPIQQIPIATETLLERVEELARFEPDVLNIHGGEPTIAKGLIPVLKRARTLGISETHLQTNGIRLADQTLVSELVDLGVQVFVISLHGHTAEIQEKITRTPRSFDKIIQGIRNCIALGALVRTNCVICQDNIDSLYEALALSCELGVPWQNISALHPSLHAMSRFHELVVHPHRVRGVLPEAVNRLIAQYPHTKVELEGFAYCHTPGLENRHIDTSLRRIRMSYHDETFEDYEQYMNETQRRLLPACFGCDMAAKCNGVYHAYTTEFEGPVVWPIVDG